MRRPNVAGALVLALLMAGCGQDSTPTLADPAPSKDRAPLQIEDPYEPEIDPADFGGPIDNSYMPLTPGRTLVYQAEVDGAKELNTVLTTDKTKEILGVECTVVLDEVFVDGVIEERTWDWYAQDKDGNVWYFGELSKIV